MYKLIGKYHNLFLNLSKVFMAGGAVYFLWQHKEIPHIWYQSEQVLSFKIWLVILVLSTFNWFFEIKKWQVLASFIKPISFQTAAKQSLISFSVSLLTPNRIGEYGAKSLFYPKKKIKNVLSLNFIGNVSQLLITLLMGIIAGLFLWQYLPITFLKEGTVQQHYILLGIVFLALISFGVIWFKHRFLDAKKIIFDAKIWQQGLAFALVRYLIFSSQFVLLLYLLHSNVAVYHLFLAVWLTYLGAAIIPVLAFFDWAVKGSVAVSVLSLLQIPSAVVFKVVMLMWTANFLIPFLIGTYLFWRYKPTQV
jgi:hypothetical protein